MNWLRKHPGAYALGFAVFTTVTLWREWPDPWAALICGSAWSLAFQYVPLGGKE